MRILLKLIAGLVALAAIAAGAGVAYLHARYPDVPPPENVTIAATPEMVERGRYLSNHVSGCVVCHAERDHTKYAMPLVPATRGKGGDSFGSPDTPIRVLVSKNITPAGIGSWSDGEVIRAMRSGVSRNGEPLFPIMPYPRYAKLAREDVVSIVAYLRTLDPITYTAPERELAFPLSLIVRTIPAHAGEYPAMPPKTDRVRYGEYVTNAAVCAECHTPMDEEGAPIPGREFAGGFEFRMPGSGVVVRSANITPDADTGIGTWSEQQFIDRFKAFDGAEHRTLSAAEQRENTIMPWYEYAGMTREDLGAIYTYLRTLKPVINRVQKHD